ncbi:MAG: 3'(2'),5'-bisphosphate nucleotidase CysQ [Gammaproteobacteria bacterium]
MINAIVRLAQQAGEKILELYQQAEVPSVDTKPDGSPVTLADRVANDMILEGLARITPEVPVLSEEATDIPYVERARWKRYWLVDPLDGTKEFLAHTGEFTVNIALIEHHQPLMGVVYAPLSGMVYFAARGQSAYRQSFDNTPERIQIASRHKIVRIISSRRYALEALHTILSQIPHYEMLNMGSSLKFCRVAEGAADIYPRLGLTSEWDTGAGQCILEAAGGCVIDLRGLPLRYNTGDSIQNPHFIAFGERRRDALEALFLS